MIFVVVASHRDYRIHCRAMGLAWGGPDTVNLDPDDRPAVIQWRLRRRLRPGDRFVVVRLWGGDLASQVEADLGTLWAGRPVVAGELDSAP